MTSKNTKTTTSEIEAWQGACARLTIARAEAEKADAARADGIVKARSDARYQGLTDTQIAAHVADETRLAQILARTKELEAEDVEGEARAIASWRCDARDVAASVPEALACDLSALHADIAADRDEAARLHAELRAEIEAVEARGRAKIEAVKARSSARVASARQAVEALTAKRTAAGEPPARHIPAGNVEAEIAAILAAGPVAAKSNADYLRDLRREETTLRVSLETAHREAERKKKAHEQDVREHEAKQKAQREQSSRNHEAWVNKARAEQAEQDAIAAAHRARTA